MEESKLTSKCYICEQEFNQYEFEAHFVECDQEHECETCHKVFQTENLLENHQAVVHDEMNKDHLKIQTIQDGCKDYKCDSCGESFSSKYYLKKHLHIIHEGHEDYKCDSCSKLFSFPNSLKRHICPL